MLIQSCSLISVKQLRTIMRNIPQDYLLKVNNVGNLTILEQQEDGLRYAGYIEIGNESFELFPKEKPDSEPANSSNKVCTDDKIAQVVTMRESGNTFPEIAKFFGCSSLRVRQIYQKEKSHKEYYFSHELKELSTRAKYIMKQLGLETKNDILHAVFDGTLSYNCDVPNYGKVTHKEVLAWLGLPTD